MPDITLGCEGLKNNGSLLTNFTVTNAIPLYCAEDPKRMVAVDLRIRAPDGEHEVYADMRSSIVHQILTEVPSCRLTRKDAAGIIDVYLIQQAAASGKRRILIQEFGLQRLDGRKWAFAAGDELLGDHGAFDVVIHPYVEAVHLAWREDIDALDAVERVVRAMEGNRRTVLPTFMYTLLASLRSEISKLGITTFPVLYLVGPQNSGKSWLIENYGLLYDDKTGSTAYGKLDASSSDKGIIRFASAYKDLVIAVDDLLKSKTSSAQRERMSVIEKSLRFIANGSERATASRDKAGASQRCQAGAVFTGEIPLDTPSAITRMLKVSLAVHTKNGQASDRATAAAALRQWIIWLLPHLDGELSELKMLLEGNRGGEEARLETTKILFTWVAELFYRFALELDIVDESYRRSAVDMADTVFSGLLDAQSERVTNIQTHVQRGNLSFYILKGYHDHAFHIVLSREDLKHDKQGASKKARACLVENGALCIRTETLLNYLREEDPFAGLSEIGMTKALRKEGVLSDNTKEKRAARKKIHGKRYLELRFSDLKKASQKY